MTQSQYDVFLSKLWRSTRQIMSVQVVAMNQGSSRNPVKSLRDLCQKACKARIIFCTQCRTGKNTVGLIWLRANTDRPTPSGIIFGLRIVEKFRGMGHGKQAMLLIEERARELGLKSIGLHVFGVNTVARNLYEGLGYAITRLNMQKQL